ncbi:MAG: TMEM175 family protein [Chloroflexota bacterium]|nr:TMEM175 family protein [Chloroflexota bacterium]
MTTGDSGEPIPATGREGGETANARDTNRLEAFSDGVFAIAITLLIIEIRPPHIEVGQGSPELLRALLDLWPAYLGYVISFLTIGTMWINHHHIFGFIARTDPGLVAINTVFLLCVAFIPFPTALMTEYLGDPGQQVATLVFGGWFTVTAIAYNLLWWYPSRDRRLIEPNAPQKTLDTITHRYRLGPPIYIVSTLLALFSPILSVAIYLVLAIVYLIPYRGGAPEPA